MVTTLRRISRELTTQLKKRERETTQYRVKAVERFFRDPSYRSMVFDIIDESSRRNGRLGEILTDLIVEKLVA